MIAGISLILNPRTPYAADMKEILRLFMEQHPHNPKADDFTQQEATIVSVYPVSFPPVAHLPDSNLAPPWTRKRGKAGASQPAPSAQYFGRTDSTGILATQRSEWVIRAGYQWILSSSSRCPFLAGGRHTILSSKSRGRPVPATVSWVRLTVDCFLLMVLGSTTG